LGYGVVSRVFHWLTVLMVFTMIPVGLTMVQEIPRATQDRLFILHKGLGVCVLVVVVLRVAWRAFHPAPPLPPSVPALQARVAVTVHALLYLALLTMAVSGYVRVTMGGFPIELLGALGVPPLLPKDEAIAAIAKAIHFGAALGLIALVVIHVAAAAYHAIVLRDGVFSRMWPPFLGPNA